MIGTVKLLPGVKIPAMGTVGFCDCVDRFVIGVLVGLDEGLEVRFGVGVGFGVAVGLGVGVGVGFGVAVGFGVGVGAGCALA